MNKLEIAKKVIEDNFLNARCGIFCTRNICGDEMKTIYNGEGLTIDICYYYAYFEVFGLTKEDFKELRSFYESLCEAYDESEDDE